MRLLLVLVALTVFIKIGATFLQSEAGLVFNWATPGALAGLIGGTVAMLLALRLPRRWRAAFAGAALMIALLLVNLLPVNPYFDATLADWRQGAICTSTDWLNRLAEQPVCGAGVAGVFGGARMAQAPARVNSGPWLPSL